MSPNQLAFVRRQTVKVTAVAADVEPIISDDRTGPETILFFGLLIQSAFSLISPNEFSRFLFVAADNSIFGGRVNKAIDNGRSRIGIGADACFPNDRAVVGVQTQEVAGLCADVNAILCDGGAAFDRTAQLSLENDVTVIEIETVIEMIFAANVYAVADDRRRRVGFKSGLILPHQRTVVGVQTVDRMIEIADYQPITHHAGRGLCA